MGHCLVRSLGSQFWGDLFQSRGAARQIGCPARYLSCRRPGCAMTGQTQLLAGLPEIATLETERQKRQDMRPRERLRKSRIGKKQCGREGAGVISKYGLKDCRRSKHWSALPCVEPLCDLVWFQISESPAQRLG